MQSIEVICQYIRDYAIPTANKSCPLNKTPPIPNTVTQHHTIITIDPQPISGRSSG